MDIGTTLDVTKALVGTAGSSIVVVKACQQIGKAFKDNARFDQQVDEAKQLLGIRQTPTDHPAAQLHPLDALYKGRYVVTIAGLHGTATRAVQLLLKDRALLRRIAQDLWPGADTFQILLRVSNIQHDPRGSRPRTIELVGDPVPFDLGRREWEEAAKAIRRKLLSREDSAPGSERP
jgi:hypothetical protein